MSEETKNKVHSPLRPIAKRFRKLLVVVDDSPESKVAIRFASARAAHITGGGLILFHCIRPSEFQHWVAVADRMREEAYEEAQLMMDQIADDISDYCGVTPEMVITEGEPSDELVNFIKQRNNLFGLFLGTDVEGGPGPLIDYFTHQTLTDLPCPVMLIPGSMTFEQIDAMA